MRRFEVRSEDGFLAAGIPFMPAFQWRLHGSGNIWALLGGEYRLIELDHSGDTLRTITREFEPFPVTEADKDAALEDLGWFVKQGGVVDRSKIPSTKPAASRFCFDDEGNIWVVRVTTAEEENMLLDVFDPSGRYLGEVRLPFRLSIFTPVVRNSTMWALTSDELDVPYVVRARIMKSSE